MATKIIPKKSSVLSKVPLSTDLEVGELALNLADQKIYTKTAADDIIVIGIGKDIDASTLNSLASSQFLRSDANTSADGVVTFNNNVEFVSPNGNNTITMRMLDSDTLTFNGESGQLFSISDDLTGTVFSVNDITGIPLIEADADATIRLAEFDGNVLIGTATDDGTNKLQVNGGVSVKGDLSLPDNSSAYFGDSNDLQIYHTGADSVIQDAGAGDLYIKASNNIWFQGNSSNDVLARMNDGGAVTLYYDNSAKFATTTSGVDVTGTVTADGLFVKADQGIFEETSAGRQVHIVPATTGNQAYIRTVNTSSGFTFQANSIKNILGVDGVGNISFYNDTGDATKLYWNSSLERLGIGTVSPQSLLHLQSASPSLRLTDTVTGDYALFTQAGGNLNISVDPANTAADTDIVFLLDGSEKVRIKDTGNVGIGTATPAYKLDVNGESRLNGMPFKSSGAVRSISTHSNSGLMRLIGGADNISSSFIDISGSSYNDSSPYISFVNNGTTRVLIDAAGNIGIGTTTPAYKLDVNGDANIGTNLTVGGDLIVSGNTVSVNTTNLDVEDAVITLNKGQTTPLNDIGILFQRYATANTTNYNVGLAWEEGTDRLVFGKTPEDGSDNDLSFAEEWMTITGDGNVGIGTSSPAQKLDVHGSIAVLGKRIATRSGTVTYLGSVDTGDQVRIRTDGTDKVTISTSGDVGVGTVNPVSKLHVFANDAADIYSGTATGQTNVAEVGHTLFLDNTNNTDGSFAQIAFRNGSSGQIFNRIASVRDASGEGSLRFVTGNSSAASEKMIIDAAGNVGIGTTTPEYELDVNGSIAIRNGSALVGKDASNGDTQLLYWAATSGTAYYGRSSLGGTVSQHEFRTAGATRLTVDVSGNVGIGTTSPSTKLDVNGVTRSTTFQVQSNGAIDSASATTTATTQVAIDSWSASAYGGGKVLIEAKDGTNRHITELLVTHDGTTATATEYGTVATSSYLATYDVDISGGTVRILATPTSSNSTVFKVMRTTMFS